MPPILLQLGSAFIAPALAGAGALAVAVPIAIHLLSRLRRKRERWGAMRFLRLAYQKQKNRLRLEQWLLLATRCLLVALIGLALSGPVLGGAWAAWLGGASGAGRTVHVVVDDALSSGGGADGEDRDAAARFEALRAEARAWVSASGAGDRVVLWTTTGRGSSDGSAAAGLAPVAVSEAGAARGGVSAALSGLEPGYGAADWEGVVSALAADAAERGAGLEVSGGDVVAVVSGFARGAGRLEEPASAGVGGVDGSGALMRLGDVAAVVLSRPGASRGNVQVASAAPRRATVLAADGAAGASGVGGEVEVTVAVRRFGDTAESSAAAVEVALLSLGDGADPVDPENQNDSAVRPGYWRGGEAVSAEPVGTATRELRFGVGQAVATAVVPVRWSAEAMDGG
ncbi:MAG: BatA domain-containing protein, partial [Planctomycetota bacterium]